MRRPRLGVLASGSGSNLQALLDASFRGDLPADVVLVISSNSTSGALHRAANAGVPAIHISARTHGDPDLAMLACLEEHGIDVVVLAGYTKLLGGRVLARYPERVVNIHPAPLPGFGGPGMYGRHVHEAVLASGSCESGPTVHLVTERYDEGPVLAWIPVPVKQDDTPDTLAQRVLKAEHDLYWRVIRDRFCRAGQL